MKYVFFISTVLLFLISTSSCGKKVEACANFNKAEYSVSDTIIVDASCSEKVGTYLWEPQAGLQMLGNGNGPTERFIVLPLPGFLSRTIKLTVSNSSSVRQITKSALIL
jgi:hypothetical protein